MTAIDDQFAVGAVKGESQRSFAANYALDYDTKESEQCETGGQEWNTIDDSAHPPSLTHIMPMKPTKPAAAHKTDAKADVPHCEAGSGSKTHKSGSVTTNLMWRLLRESRDIGCGGTGISRSPIRNRAGSGGATDGVTGSVISRNRHVA